LFTTILIFAVEALLLAFQHYIVMLGTTVLIASTLVPLMGGNHVSVLIYEVTGHNIDTDTSTLIVI
jgi:hypothetical protein